MTPLSKRTLEWMFKGEVFLQLFNKSKLRNGTKTFLQPNFFLFVVKIKKLGFSASLSLKPSLVACAVHDILAMCANKLSAHLSAT